VTERRRSLEGYVAPSRRRQEVTSSLLHIHKTGACSYNFSCWCLGFTGLVSVNFVFRFRHSILPPDLRPKGPLSLALLASLPLFHPRDMDLHQACCLSYFFAR